MIAQLTDNAHGIRDGGEVGVLPRPKGVAELDPSISD